MISKYEKTYRVKLFALVAVLAMVFAGAAVMMDDGVDAAPEGTTYLSGDVTATQTFGTGTNVVVNGNLNIPAGMALVINGGKFTVESGATIKIAAGGQLILLGTSNVTINGNIIATGTITTEDAADYAKIENSPDYYAAIVNQIDEPVEKTSGLIVAGTITLERGAQLISVPTGSGTFTPIVGDDSAEKDITITGTGKGVIALQNGASIDVTKRNTQISEISGQTILMNQGATVSINAHANNVTLQATSTSPYYTAGKVIINSEANDYVDPEGKDSAKLKSTSNLTFTVTSQTTPALIKNEADGATKDTPVTVRQYVINIEGTIDAGDNVAVESAVANNDAEDTAYEFYEVTEDGKIPASDGVKIDMPSASVTGSLTVTKNSSGTTGSTQVSTLTLNGYMIVSGTLTGQYNVNTTDSSKNAFAGVDVGGTPGTLYITGSVSFHFNSIYDETDGTKVSGVTIYIDGGKMTIYGAAVDQTYNLETKVYAGAYTVTDETGSNSTSYFCDFTTAVEEAIAAGADEVWTFAAGADAATDAKEAIEAGAPVIDGKITIPADMTLHVFDALVVGENGELELMADAIVSIEHENYTIYVQGKVTDHDGVMSEYDENIEMFDYEVKKTTEGETETIYTYTTLKIALGEAVSGDEIQLSKPVTIEENMTIPEGVTVSTVDATGAVLTIKSATLTVNGTLVITNNSSTVTLTNATNSKTVGSVTVNNIVQNATNATFTDGSTGVTPIAGAYFNGTIGEVEDTNFITSPAVAAANVANNSTGAIDINGKISLGDITFTQGDVALTINVFGEVNGNVTLNGESVTFDVSADGTSKNMSAGVFTGSVTYAATAGNATVDMTKVGGVKLASASFNDGTAITNTLTMAGSLKGAATVSAGTVYVNETLTVTYTKAENKVAEDKAVLTVASGATLNVSENATLTVNANGADTKAKAYAGLVVDGTLVVDEGTLDLDDKAENNTYCDAQADINGTMTYGGKTTAVEGVLNVNGAVNVTENHTLNITKMYVAATGAVTGAIGFNAGGFVAAYANADVSGAAIDETDGTSNAAVTQYYVNGEVYMTSYANDDTKIGAIIPTPIEMTGYEDIVLGAAGATSWYTDESMSTELTSTDASNNNASEYTAVYAKADLLSAAVRLSIGPGMSVYIDDVRYTSSVLELAVGEHSIVIQVNPGYSGTTTVTLGGTAITGGTFTITPEIAEEYEFESSEQTNAITLSVMGDIAYDTGSTDDGGMGLTEILLIILVVLIVVMAIMVALRLMRS